MQIHSDPVIVSSKEFIDLIKPSALSQKIRIPNRLTGFLIQVSNYRLQVIFCVSDATNKTVVETIKPPVGRFYCFSAWAK
tara:strand:+ start:2736 stop:2975 length:240 start_codon:yes stop_codon:yes gene_type:complete